MPTGAGDGSWGEGVRWRTADGAMTRLSVNKVSKRRLMELAIAAGSRGRGARLVPKKHHARLGIVVFEKTSQDPNSSIIFFSK